MRPSRRQFLKGLVGTPVALSLSSSLPGVLWQTAVASQNHSDDGRVLVVLQLSGGNDGLNTVVPFADDVYGRSRRTLRLSKKDVLPFNEQLGFHPRMPGFRRLLDEGLLTVIQGVGYPRSKRDHDAAMRDWHTARPDQQNCPTGWLGRATDVVARNDPTEMPSALVAPIPTPFALNAARSVVPSVRRSRDWQLQLPRNGADRWFEALQSDDPDSASLRQFVVQNLIASRVTSEKVAAVARDATTNVAYPNTGLASQLKTVAELIRADLGTRIFFVELGGGGIGGFDNHANQRDNHAAVLHELSESVAAFATDLAKDELLDRVLLMTFSEFGRTVSENGRRGTDHGAAAPMFVVGPRARGGLYGDHPDLRDLEGDAPKAHTDFRRIYATMLKVWLNIDHQQVLERQFQPINDLFT